MISATSGHSFYEVVRIAMQELGIEYKENSASSILVWWDTIKDQDYFRSLYPWQVVNRLPNVNIICRKAPFVRAIQRIQKFFPEQFNYLPKSYILPLQKDFFMNQVNKHQKTYIVKPDNGALGQGIVVIKPIDSYQVTNHLSVAQEYKNSYLIEGFKFDLRIYCLVIGSDKLDIYVYHDGIARFCSAPADSGDQFGQLTNTAVNIKNPLVTAESITRIVSDVFADLKKKGADIDKLWHDIENAMALTVLSAAPFIINGAKLQCSANGYPRCFQLLGFDVLLDENLKPWILEVNYRPSLEYGTQSEKALKIRMLKELMSIACPYGNIETELVFKKKPMQLDAWRTFISKNKHLVSDSERKRQNASLNTKFVKVFPEVTPDRAVWNSIFELSMTLPSEIGNGYHLPRELPSTFKPIIKAPESSPHSPSDHSPKVNKIVQQNKIVKPKVNTKISQSFHKR